MSWNCIDNINFHYYEIEMRYEYITKCHENGCDDEGICRCGKIHNAKITSINVPGIVERMYVHYFGENKSILEKRNNTIIEILSGAGRDINIYCIDRIVKHFKLWEKKSFIIKISDGYYGEEIDGIFLKSDIANKIEKEIEYVNNLTTVKEKIEYLLLLEYGNVLPKLQNCFYEIEKIEKSKIIFGSNSHYDKVKNKCLEFYSDDKYDKIRGIAIEEGDKYKIIDGYHRVHMNSKADVKLIIAKKSRD